MSDPITIAALETRDYEAAQRFRARVAADIAAERAAWGYPPARATREDLTGAVLDDNGNMVFPPDDDTDEAP